MKVLYIHQYFKTPEEPGGTRSYWFSKELISRGINVVMITSTNSRHPEEGKYVVDGIDVVYVKNEYSNYFSPARKVYSFLKFMTKSIRVALKEKNVDLVYATSTPLTVGYVALVLKKLKKWRFIFEVRDLWPEFPIEIGAIKNKFLIRYLRGLEKRIYQNAEYVVALSPGMKEGVLSVGIPGNKVCVIPNMSKPEEFFPHEPSVTISERFNIDLNKFNAIHFGSMGKANGLDYIIDAAILAAKQGHDDLNFIFMGDGATLPGLRQKVEMNSLKNVQFLGSHNMKVVAEIVNCCQVTITSFLDLPILYTNSPNKLFDSLSAGKPVIVNSAGWTKELVENENCGCYVNPHNPQYLVDKLLEIKNNKELLTVWGENARRISITMFDRTILSCRMADLIENIANNNQENSKGK